MPTTRAAEIHQNYRYFQSQVASLMPTHAGEYALLHSCEIVDYYVTAGEAVTAGTRRFGETPFSIQHVIDRPIDLGFLSHASDIGDTTTR